MSNDPSACGRPRPVVCDEHGSSWGYVVCDCVRLHGAPIAEVNSPLENSVRIGEILCAREGRHPLAELVLICGACARLNGWLKASQ